MFAIQNKTNSALLQFGKTFNVLIDILIYIYIYIYINQRQKKESFWIRGLQTLHPEGINKKA